MKVYYEEYGDKDAPLMVYLHGGGVSSWMWEKQVQHFTNYHCVVIDLPEQGRSSDEKTFSIESSAASIIELIEKLGNGKSIILIGFSLGAQVAIQILSMKYDLIDYTIVNSVLVRPMPFTKKFIRPTIRLTYPFIKIRAFSKLQAKTLYIDQEYYETYYQESSQMTSDTLIRILEENMSFRIPNTFKKAKGKILVTVGAKEKAVMRKSASDIVASHANCTGIIIPKVGHGISMAKPQYFNRMIENWLEDGSTPKDVEMIKSN